MLAADPGSKKWPKLHEKFRGENFGTNLSSENFTPKSLTPPVRLTAG